MIVGIVSPVSQSGKSTMALLLAGIYARSQAKVSVIFSTTGHNDYEDLATPTVVRESTENPYILGTGIIGTAEPTEVLSYGEHFGPESVYFFNMFNNALDESERIEQFSEIVKHLKADLKLIEITGDLNRERNKLAISLCDCLLIVYPMSDKVLTRRQRFIDTLPDERLKVNNISIISKYQSKITTQKELCSRTGLNINDVIFLPYNDTIEKFSWKKELTKLTREATVGTDLGIPLRTPYQEIMSSIFDTSKVKSIREVSRWYR